LACFPYGTCMRRCQLIRTAVMVRRMRRPLSSGTSGSPIGGGGAIAVSSRELTMASEVPLPEATAEMKLRSHSGSESTVKVPHRNGYRKLNGNGQSLVKGIERLTAKSAAGRGRITDFIDQLQACGLREDTLGSLPTESLLRILQGLTARLANKKMRMDQRSNSLVTRIAEIVTDRAQEG
ncbi:hypothetical protein FOZ63_006534, partial [Perkinsus olseni]